METKKLLLTLLTLTIIIVTSIFISFTFTILNDPSNKDSDNDNITDDIDQFPDNPNEQNDSDGDGVGDNSDAFPDDPTETVDSDGDGVGDNSDDIPDDPTETVDSDDDGWGDNSDVFPDDPNEWADSDNDGIGDNSDINRYVDLSIDITLDKFKVTSQVDLLRWAQVYFEIKIGNSYYEQVKNNGKYWYVLLSQTKQVDYSFTYDVPDDTDDTFTTIEIVMYDYDLLKDDDIIDINSEPDQETLILKYDHIHNNVVSESPIYGDKGTLWYDISIPEEVEPPDNIITKYYKWYYGGKNWELTIDIPEKKYTYYKEADVDRTPQNNLDSSNLMAQFVTYKDKIIEDIALEINSIVEQENYNESQKINLILRFVQKNVEYNSDNDSKGCIEYWRYPIETLVDQVGDCEDSAVLFASITKALGYDTAILFYILDDDIGHLAIGIHLNTNENLGHYVTHNNKKYFYCETTPGEYLMGRLPKDIDKDPVEIIPIL